MQLTKAEEHLMEIIWNQEKVFLKDILETYTEPKPAGTTIATLLKRMQDKGFVGYNMLGNSRQYYALVKKKEYFKKAVSGMVKNFFGDSSLQFASFFASNGNLTKNELEALRQIIDKEIKKKGK